MPKLSIPQVQSSKVSTPFQAISLQCILIQPWSKVSKWIHGKTWPSWSTDESLSFRRNPMLCQEFAAIAFQHVAAIIGPVAPFFTPASLLNHRPYKNLPNSSNKQIISNSYGFQLHPCFFLNHHLPKCFFFFFLNPTCASKVNSESRRCKFSGRKKWQQGESRTDKLQPRGGNRFVSGTLRR